MTLCSDASAGYINDTYCDILIVERIYMRHMFTLYLLPTHRFHNLLHVGTRKHGLKDHFTESSSASAIPVVPMNEMIPG